VSWTVRLQDVVHLHGADELQYDGELLQHELNAITSPLAGRAGGYGKEGSK